MARRKHRSLLLVVAIGILTGFVFLTAILVAATDPRQLESVQTTLAPSVEATAAPSVETATTAASSGPNTDDGTYDSGMDLRTVAIVNVVGWGCLCFLCLAAQAFKQPDNEVRSVQQGYVSAGDFLDPGH